MKSRRRILKVLLALGGLLLLGASVLWVFPQQVLTVDSGPVKADVIVVLGGGALERPKRAAELFQSGEAPVVICSGKGDCESNRRMLVQGGVPRTVIQLECDSRNTSENARFTIPLLRQLGARRVIIVTSWHHSRRALNCFRHYAPDIQFYSRPSCFGYPGQAPNAVPTTQNAPRNTQNGLSNLPSAISHLQSSRSVVSGPSSDAERRAVRGYVRSEYVKLLGYWLRYGVCPL